jgi:transcriptional regulator with XRE-family HTH domain
LAILTIEQLRAARALLDWTQTELAERAGLSAPTIKRLEAGFGPAVSDGVRAKLRYVLEQAGVEFLDDGDGLGVRLRKQKKKDDNPRLL